MKGEEDNRRDSDYASTLSFSRHFLGMTFRKVALPENNIWAWWRAQQNASLMCVAYVSQRDMLDQTQGHPAMQISPWNFQMRTGSHPTSSECGQNKFLSDSQPECRHIHSSEFALTVFGMGRWFQAHMQTVKAKSWMYCEWPFQSSSTSQLTS